MKSFKEFVEEIEENFFEAINRKLVTKKDMAEDDEDEDEELDDDEDDEDEDNEDEEKKCKPCGEKKKDFKNFFMKKKQKK